jgi:hypothetical protein
MKVEVWLLQTALDGGDWSVSRRGRFNSGAKNRLYRVDHTATLEAVEIKKKLSMPGIKPRFVGRPYSLYRHKPPMPRKR